MKKMKLSLFLLVFMFLAACVFAEKTSSANFVQNVIVSEGGKSSSSSSYKTNVAVGIINGIISSSSFINKLGFFHILLLADGQPCTSENQCEGGFCCSNSCSSSACPSGGGGGGGAGAGGGGSNITPEGAIVTDFSVTPASINERLALGASKTDAITITNTGDTALSFSLSVSQSISKFISLQESSFSLAPGQQKIINADIIAATLGSYLGSIDIAAGGITKSVDIVLDIVSQQVLFDVKMDIPPAYKEIEPGQDLKAQITLFNIGQSKLVGVTPTYIIKDRQGKVIYETSETFAVEKQTSYVKSLTIPKNAPLGDYLAVVELRYANSFAVSSELFKVVQKEVAEKPLISRTAMTYVLLILAGLIFLFVYLLIPKMGFPHGLEKCRKLINQAKDALGNNDLARAKELYVDALDAYENLAYADKQEVYKELVELYNSIIQK